MKTLIVATGFLISSAYAGTNQKSFTPSKYLYPITRIELLTANGNNSQTLYTCSGATPRDCLVDMADSNALAELTAKVQDVKVDAGTYTGAKLWNCGAGTTGLDSAGSVTVRGSATVGVGAANFVTTSTGLAVGTAPADVSIPWACGGALVTFPTPIVVQADSAQSFNLLVDLSNVVWTDPNVSGGMGGCYAGVVPAQGVCSAMPAVIPYFGTGTPTLERYEVAHSSVSAAAAAALTHAQANAAINLGIDPSGAVFYVGVQPLYSETSPSGADATNGGPDYNTATRKFSTNADGSVSFQTGGGPEDNRVGYTAFFRHPATGTWNSAGTCKNETSATTWFYHAF